MPWLDGEEGELHLLFLDDRSQFPFITTASCSWKDPETGEIHTIPKNFRTDGASLPIALSALPVVGPALVMRYFGHGVFMGFKEGVLHDYLRRRPAIWEGDKIVGYGEPPVPALVAHEKFNRALTEAGYPDDMIENYVAAVRAFNTNDDPVVDQG